MTSDSANDVARGAGLRQNLVDQLTMHISQPEITPRVSKRQLFMIKAQAVEHCGVQVMDADWVLCGFEAELVSGTVNRSALDATAGQPHAETPMIVIPS